MNLREAAEMAFTELCNQRDAHYTKDIPTELTQVINALRQALAQPKQEPVAWFVQYSDSHEFLWSKPEGWRVKQALEIQPLYTAPPKKEWVGLTDEEKYDVLEGATGDGGRVYYDTLFQSYEAKLKEKNGG